MSLKLPGLHYSKRLRHKCEVDKPYTWVTRCHCRTCRHTNTILKSILSYSIKNQLSASTLKKEVRLGYNLDGFHCDTHVLLCSKVSIVCMLISLFAHLTLIYSSWDGVHERPQVLVFILTQTVMKCSTRSGNIEITSNVYNAVTAYFLLKMTPM